jgi:hypothetical protein
VVVRDDVTIFANDDACPLATLRVALLGQAIHVEEPLKGFIIHAKALAQLFRNGWIDALSTLAVLGWLHARDRVDMHHRRPHGNRNTIERFG